MKDSFEIHVSEPEGYKVRNFKATKLNFIISFLILLLVAKVSDIYYGLLLGFFVFFVQYFKAKRWDRFFITHIHFSGKVLNITYMEETNEKILAGNLEDFEFVKKMAINKTRTPYLSVFYAGELKVKQFEIGQWNEKKFDEVIHCFKNFKINK